MKNRKHKGLTVIIIALTLFVFSLALRSEITIPDFIKSTQDFVQNLNTCETALADFDADGDLDLVFGTNGTAKLASPSLVLFNDGKGNFEDSGLKFPSEMHGVAAGDLDGDDDMDLIFAPGRDKKPIPVFFNDGKGGFQRSTQDLSLDPTERIRLVDIDKDGDLDVYSDRNKQIYLNDGKGNFEKSSSTLPQVGAFSDMNGDGYMDLICWEKGTGILVFVNDKKGHFTEQSQIPLSGLIFCFMECADIDNDGDNDIIFTNGFGSHKNPGGVLRNDGTGRLTDTGQRLAPEVVGWIGTGDLNNDGYTDVVITDTQVPSQIWLNNGRGIFIDSGIRLGEGGMYWTNCLIRDIDNDGDRDIFITNRITGNHGLWFNQLNPRENKAKGLIIKPIPYEERHLRSGMNTKGL